MILKSGLPSAAALSLWEKKRPPEFLTLEGGYFFMRSLMLRASCEVACATAMAYVVSAANAVTYLPLSTTTV